MQTNAKTKLVSFYFSVNLLNLPMQKTMTSQHDHSQTKVLSQTTLRHVGGRDLVSCDKSVH